MNAAAKRGTLVTRMLSQARPTYELPNRIVDVSTLAKAMRFKVRSRTKTLPRPLRLAGLLADGPGQVEAEKYSTFIESTFTQDGLEYELVRCDFRPEAVESKIRELNTDKRIDGILVFYPLFPQRSVDYGIESSMYMNPATGVHYRKSTPPVYLNPGTGVYYKTVDDYLRDCVTPSKDVEGLCHEYTTVWQRQLFRSRGGVSRTANDVYIPCTATAVLKILEAYHPSDQTTDVGQGRWDKTIVTVVNRSTILGRPLAAMLALEGATVYSVDEKSVLQFKPGGTIRRCDNKITMDECLRQSQIIVTAVPGDDYVLDIKSIPDETTVIDVSNHSNLDVDTLLLEKGGIRLVQSVGKVTIAALEQSLVRLYFEFGQARP